MDAVRDVCDRIEAEVDDSLWPLPKYREMLGILSSAKRKQYF